MQKILLLISTLSAILLSSACNTETNTFYYSKGNHTQLSLFEDAIDTEGELKGSICKISIDASTTKALIEIAKSGHKMEELFEDDVFFVITDGREKLLLLNGFKQVQLADNTIFQLSKQHEHQLRVVMLKFMPREKCREK